MKKLFCCVLALILLWSFVFAIPAQAEVNKRVLASYVNKQSGAQFYFGSSLVFPGSHEYWRVRIIEQQSWTGENRPEKLMGDANIDGKVDARDALVALYFGLYGNERTVEVSSPPKTPSIYGLERSYQAEYNAGKLQERINNPNFWLTYCRDNSPFFADVTKDCVVNALDALQILKYSVGKAKNFPVGDFTSITNGFYYIPWPTEYYPGFFNDLISDMTDEEFCKKYNFEWETRPTDQ